MIRRPTKHIFGRFRTGESESRGIHDVAYTLSEVKRRGDGIFHTPPIVREVEGRSED